MVFISECEDGNLPVYSSRLTASLDLLSGLIVILAIASLWYGFRSKNELDSPSLGKRIILTIWVVAPPAWFAFEFFVIYKAWGYPHSFETFKYGQDLASKFWIAVSTALSALYLGPSFLRDAFRK